MRVVVRSLQQIEREYVQEKGPLQKIAMNKFDYMTLLDIEKAIKRLDRNFRRVDKYNNRKYMDVENHERREQRMQQRVKERWDEKYTLFTEGLCEEEQRYRDYFQTDLEASPEDEKVEQMLDEQDLLASEEYQLKNYDFQEVYTRQPEDDQSTHIQKKIFQFKFRIAGNSHEDFIRKNDRMTQRSLNRHQSSRI